MSKIKYFIVFTILISLLNFLSKYININDIVNINLEKEESVRVKINENIVFQEEKLEKDNNLKKDINNTNFEELIEIGLSKNKAKHILEYIEFLGQIDDIYLLENAPNISKKDIELILKNYEILDILEERYIKRNINDLSDEELELIGFSKKEIKIISKLKSKGYINSDLELKDKINNEILKKYIKF